MKTNNRFGITPLTVLLLLAILGFFCWKSSLAIDPDFGYRLRNGIEIPSKGVPRIDSYSYTMSTFPYVEHAWLVAVGMAFIHTNFGYILLSGVASLIVVLTLAISVQRISLKNPITSPYIKKYWHFGNIFFVLGIATFFNFVGVRAQVVSWLLVSVLVYVIFDEKLWKKLKLFSPLLFLLWANLHGSFAAGLSIYFVVIVLRSFRTKKFDKSDLTLFLMSIAATFANPYREGVWREVYSSISDSSLRWRVSEWMPAVFVTDLTFASYLTISTTLVSKYWKKYKLEEIGLFFFFLIQALMSARHIPIWVIVSIPIASAGIDYMYNSVKNIKFAVPRFKKVYKFALIISLCVFMYTLFFSIKGINNMSETSFYPANAVEYLKKNDFDGNLFSEYGWGGYLIWKYPEKKLFVDGRMPSWRQKNHPENQSESAFDEYIDILKDKQDYMTIFEKYNINIVLWPVKRENFYGLIENKINNVFKLFGISGDEELDFIERLENDGWSKVYDDGLAAIYLNK
jgi:hypothetical protein